MIHTACLFIIYEKAGFLYKKFILRQQYLVPLAADKKDVASHRPATNDKMKGNIFLLYSK